MIPNGSPHNRLIAFVSNSAWSLYNFRLDVIRSLIGQGYEILVIAADDEFSSLLVSEGCRYVPIDFNNRSENPWQDFRLYRQFRKIYAGYRPDFIFHFVIKPNIYGSLAAAACSIRSIAVVTGLGYSFASKNWLYRLVRILYRRALKRTTAVWFLNNEDAKMFISEKIVPIQKMKVLPGEGINTDYFSPVPKTGPTTGSQFTFLMSTRLLKSKGIGVYADAARILKKKHDNLQFMLLGFFENSHPDSISEEELRTWQQEGLVLYQGFARDVRPFLGQADCFVFPSFYNEGIPRCLLEAASMEVPIITSFNRGCKEVVLNNSNGYICNVNDPFDLADKMEKMINLPAEERARMGRNGRAHVMRKFNVTRVIEEYLRTLREAVPASNEAP